MPVGFSISPLGVPSGIWGISFPKEDPNPRPTLIFLYNSDIYGRGRPHRLDTAFPSLGSRDNFLLSFIFTFPLLSPRIVSPPFCCYFRSSVFAFLIGDVKDLLSCRKIAVCTASVLDCSIIMCFLLLGSKLRQYAINSVIIISPYSALSELHISTLGTCIFKLHYNLSSVFIWMHSNNIRVSILQSL